MNAKPLFLIVLIVALLTACAQATPAVNQPTAIPSLSAPTSTTAPVVPTTAPTTAAPTTAPTQAPTVAPTAAPTVAPTEAKPNEVGIVFQTADHTFHLVNANLMLGSAYTPAYTGLNPRGGMIDGKAYVYDSTNGPMVMAVDANESVQQDYIKNPTYGLAVFAGEQPRLGWGTQLIVPNTPSSLQVSAPDGSQLETLFQQQVSVPPVQVVAQRWSTDGKSLYFSREPVGLGGYIVFSGASSLYKIDVTSKQEIELIPVNASSGQAACLDALSVDYRYVADHCSQNVITIRDLTSGATTTIQPPEGLTGFKTMGSARFSPDGSRVAFALAKNDPSGEQGWVAVSDGLQGASKLVLTGDPGSSYAVIGWLTDQTLLIQSTPVPGCEGCDNQIWAVNIDGSNLTKVADGSFVTSMDSH
jgi:hypothetical protein